MNTIDCALKCALGALRHGLKSVFLFLFALLPTVLTADDRCYYLSDGTGSWADKTRWQDGVVPGESKVVEIRGTAKVTAADFAVVEKQSAIVLGSSASVIEFIIDEGVDFHVPERIIGKGKIVKSGKGRLYLDGVSSNFYNTVEGIEVNDGELHLVEIAEEDIPNGDADAYAQKEFLYGPLVVNSPGKLFLRPWGLSKVPGIAGDGLITNISASAIQLCFEANVAEKAGTAYSFSGIISPNVHPTFRGMERQDMLSDMPHPVTIRAVKGTVGVFKFGNAGESGSLGSTDRIGIHANNSDVPFRFIYLGDGEKTTKEFRVFGVNPGFVFDGGAHGGLELAGIIRPTYGINKSVFFILDGTNAQPCRLAADIQEAADNNPFKDGETVASTLFKRGSGTWELAPSLRLRGLIAIEGGVLEAEKIANRGTFCSLGSSTILTEPVYGLGPESLGQVPYALLLGDGTLDGDAVGTLAYTGESIVDSLTRPVALKGSGRIRNSTTGVFSWTGITSSAPGDHALHLDGAGGDNRVCSVTNGAGNITVVKEGADTWSLDGDLDVSAFDVRGGVLNVRQRRDWKFYRVNFKKLWGDTAISIQISRFALFTEDKVCRNSSLVRNKAAEGAAWKLEPGQVAYWNSSHVDNNSDRQITNLFNEGTAIWNCYLADKSKPDPEVESSWLRFVMRPLPGAPITRYDICNAARSTENGEVRTTHPKIWSIDGSCDGENWTELTTVTNQFNSAYNKYGNVWLSSSTTNFRTGFTIPSGPTGGVTMTSADSVSVSGGGTLRVGIPLTVSRIRCDPAAGGGTVEGVSFTESGVIEVENYVRGNTKTLLPVTFTGCEGVDNLASWAVEVDGRITSKVKAGMSSDGQLYVTSVGMTVVIR